MLLRYPAFVRLTSLRSLTCSNLTKTNETKRHSLASALLVLVLMLPPADALGLNQWDRLKAHDETSAMRVDHGRWEVLLLKFIRPGADGIHRIAYGLMRNGGHSALKEYLKGLSKIQITRYRRDEQMAFWINLYNALTVNLVLDHYPIPSLRKLEQQTAASDQGPWDRKLIIVEDVSLSLNDIEKHILKPIWKDIRIHYALSCGAIGCPNLQPVPYSGALLDQQLSEVAIAYVNDKRCIAIDKGKLRVSSLYRWNIQDFGGSDQGIIHHLMAYANPDLAMTLQKFDRIHGDRFDWRLNDSQE